MKVRRKMTNQKNLKFSDFQRVLKENDGKPVYKREDDKYSLNWTLGGFSYYTEVTYKQIHSSYEKQFGRKDNKAAIEKFHDMYLKDAYVVVDSFDKEEIPLLESFPVVREQENEPENKFKYIPVTQLKQTVKKSHWMESDLKGGYIIKAINDKNAVVTVGKIENIKGKLISSKNVLK